MYIGLYKTQKKNIVLSCLVNHPEVIINKQGVVIVCFSRKITFSSQLPVEYACNEMMTSGISN